MTADHNAERRIRELISTLREMGEIDAARSVESTLVASASPRTDPQKRNAFPAR